MQDSHTGARSGATEPPSRTPQPLQPVQPPQATLPWWRYRMMWLVLGLPATVVCSSLVTAGIAWRHIDPVVTDTAPSQSTGASALEPAQRARNHAATPGR